VCTGTSELHSTSNTCSYSCAGTFEPPCIILTAKYYVHEILWCHNIFNKVYMKAPNNIFRFAAVLFYVSISALFQVGAPEVRQYRTMPDTQLTSSLSLSTILHPMHYHNGQLVLKCTAHVTTLYRQTTEVHLSARAREPIPERGTSHVYITSGATIAIVPVSAATSVGLLLYSADIQGH
jgi:hypothetical protein